MKAVGCCFTLSYFIAEMFVNKSFLRVIYVNLTPKSVSTGGSSGQYKTPCLLTAFQQEVSNTTTHVHLVQLVLTDFWVKFIYTTLKNGFLTIIKSIKSYKTISTSFVFQFSKKNTMIFFSQNLVFHTVGTKIGQLFSKGSPFFAVSTPEY